MKRLFLYAVLLCLACGLTTTASANSPGWYYNLVFDTKIEVEFTGAAGVVTDYYVSLHHPSTLHWLELHGIFLMNEDLQTISFLDNPDYEECDLVNNVPNDDTREDVQDFWEWIDSYLGTNYATQFIYFWDHPDYGPDCTVDGDGEWTRRDWFRTGLLAEPDYGKTVYPLSGSGAEPRSSDYFDRIKLKMDPRDPAVTTLTIKSIKIYLNDMLILLFQPPSPMVYQQNQELVFTDAIYSTRVNHMQNCRVSRYIIDAVEDLSNPPYDENDLLLHGPNCQGVSCYNSILDMAAKDLFQMWDYTYGSAWQYDGLTDWYFPTPPAWCSEYAAYAINEATNYSTDPAVAPSWNSTYSGYQHEMTVERMANFFKGLNLYIHPDEPAQAGKRNWRWDDLSTNVRTGYYTGHVHRNVKGEDKGSHSTFFIRWANCRKYYNDALVGMIDRPCSPTDPDIDNDVELLDDNGNPTGTTINLACQAVFDAAGGNQSSGRVYINRYNLYNLTDDPERCIPLFNPIDGDYPDNDMYWYSASVDALDDLSYAHNGFGIVEAKTWSIKHTPTTYTYKLPLTRIDPSGRILVAGLHGNDDIMEFIQYGIWQEPRWDLTVDVGPAIMPGTSIERFNNQQMQIDMYGNLFTLVNTSTQSLLLKINRHGELAWTMNLDKTLGGDFSPVAMVINSLGNIVITGNVGNTDGSSLVLLSIDTNHDVQWTNVTASASVDNPTSSLAVDQNDYLYEAGTVISNNSKKFILNKYKINGTEEWHYLFSHPDVSPVGNPRLIVNGRGEVFVTGFVYNNRDLDISKGLALLKFNADGTLAWYRFHFGENAEISHNWPIDIGVDFADNIFVMATVNRDVALTGYLLLKYDTNGVLQWTKTYDSSKRVYDQAVDMAVTGAGFAYVTGVTEREIEGNYDISTLKYDPDGNVVWTKVYNGGGQTGEGDMPGSINIDPAGNIVVTGLADTQDGMYWVINRYNNDFWWRENGCDGCLIDNTCFQIGEINPQNACQYCDLVNDAWAWTDLADATSCDDGLYCNGQDSCLAGYCQHTGDPCPGNGLYCDGVESCDEENDQCVSSGNPCPDNGLFCDGEEYCVEGATCQTTGNPCEDGEECLEDSDECVPNADDDVVDDDTIDDDDDDCGGCGGNASDWMERLF
ncbi:MAG TPA: hypothetical protein PK961_08690 [bacterium]|nr:hypothetical protein [bacterium]